jgi:hypothetical protein
VEDEPLVPRIDHYLDESDSDIVVPRRQHNGSFVAAFSALLRYNIGSLGV